MSPLAEHRLQRLLAAGTDVVTDFRVGLEKECLRVNGRGSISQRPHPMVLGSALTNPFITTDYSEA